jgi:hypothetical protein
MSNKTFLVIIGAVIIVLLGAMLMRKYEECAEQGGKACPRSRYGRSLDPHEGTGTLPAK